MSATSPSTRFPGTGRIAWRALNLMQLLFTMAWTGVLVPIAFLVWLLCGGRRHWPLRMASRIWAPGLLAGAGVQLQIDGAERIDPAQPYIVVANHQSIIDICVLFRAFPMPLRFVMKKELAKVPLIGAYARAMGMVLIERGNARDASRRLNSAATLFSSGHSLCAFPEGTRSRDGRIGPFRGGVFKLAIETGVPILPVAIDGSGMVLPASGFRVRPGVIRVRIGTPIACTGLQPSQRNELASQCHDAVTHLRQG